MLADAATAATRRRRACERVAALVFHLGLTPPRGSIARLRSLVVQHGPLSGGVQLPPAAGRMLPGVGGPGGIDAIGPGGILHAQLPRVLDHLREQAVVAVDVLEQLRLTLANEVNQKSTHVHERALGHSRHGDQQNAEERIGQVAIRAGEREPHLPQVVEVLREAEERVVDRHGHAVDVDRQLHLSLDGRPVHKGMQPAQQRSPIFDAIALPLRDAVKVHFAVRAVQIQRGPNRVEYRGALRLELVDRANPQSIRLTGQRTASWLFGRLLVHRGALQPQMREHVVERVLPEREQSVAAAPWRPPHCHLHLRTKALRVGPMLYWPRILGVPHRYHVRRRPC